MQQWIVDWIERLGYGGVGLLIAVENIFPPIPSEVILTFSGFLTTCTRLQVPGVVVFATLGSGAGALVLYGVGRLLSPAWLSALLAGPVGRALKLDAADVQKAADWFAAHGWPSVLYCRCVPIVRSLISIPAGMAGVRLAPFLLLTLAGSAVWNSVLVGLGAWAGQSWPAVSTRLARLSGWAKGALAVAGLCALAVWLVRKRRARRRPLAGKCHEESVCKK